jgi:hypothetical protein
MKIHYCSSYSSKVMKINHFRADFKWSLKKYYHRSQLRCLHDHVEGLNKLLKTDRLGFGPGAYNLPSCYMLCRVCEFGNEPVSYMK